MSQIETESSYLWNAKLTETRIFRELSIEIDYRELSNWIKELSYSIKELFNSIRELFNSIRSIDRSQFGRAEILVNFTHIFVLQPKLRWLR